MIRWKVVFSHKLHSVNKCMTSSVDNIDQGNYRSQLPDLYASNLNILVNEPTSKLYVKLSQKSNRNLIINALEHCLFPGQVNKDKKLKCLEFELIDAAIEIFADAALLNIRKLCAEVRKYDSGAKAFNEIPAKHFSANTDGFIIKEDYWPKKKSLYSKSSTMK